MWNPFGKRSQAVGGEDEFRSQRAKLLSEAPIPRLWLFGKTGSGKSSIIRYLTGAPEAVIGQGFRPQTQSARLFSFPDEELPIVRFLDTRGLGEANYDPAVDLAQFDQAAHLIIVTVRATDQAVEEVIRPLRELRDSDPKRPVLLAVTSLHDAYPGQQHPDPDPFENEQCPLPESLPGELRRAIDAQLRRFDGLFDRAVAIDLTPAEDGFAQPDFGGTRLKQAILDLLPAAYRQTLAQMDHLREAVGEIYERRTTPIILSHSALAASAAAVPIPWVDLPVVMAIQSHMVHRLARLNRQRLDAATLTHVGCAVGGRLAFRMGLREFLKFIPWVGMAINAAAAFAITYATGAVWNWYFLQVKDGHVPTDEELRQVYKTQLESGARLWRTTQVEQPS
jgi:uncharacterized protein (DUF697 family)